MEVFIPSFRYEESELERGYTKRLATVIKAKKSITKQTYQEIYKSNLLFSQVFKIEVLMNGRKHFVEKRYSEFHALHKKLKKFIRTPEIPSKHVRNWVPKVLEQRRQGLESYLQGIVLENEEPPKMFLDFLNVRHFPSLPKAESCGSFEETESEESSKLSHQPVLLFLRDPYVLPTANDDFPNVVIEGILHGLFYPHLQPR
ncbi:sorting nexin-24 [Protobothrops mucrosquamatus]|uniref:sorting nexin-24 n=1 Tax=Protobothrops mucrosquamatus TaxID=103944 RepID=UPI000775F86A|nr:sorting nexin-24 [Protobothrops mucrosquamatus]